MAAADAAPAAPTLSATVASDSAISFFRDFTDLLLSLTRVISLMALL